MARALILLCLIWGFNFVVMKTANNFFTPEIFVTYRFLSGAVVLLIVASFMKLPLPPKKFWIWIILSGALQISYCSVALQTCFKYMSAGLAAMLNYTMPIWVAILAKFFLNERLTTKKVFGIALSITGVFMLMNDDSDGHLFAVFLALSAAFGWAISNVIMKAKLTKCNAIALTTWQMVAGALMLVVYTFNFGDTTAEWTLISIACLAYNGIIASAFAFFVWVYVLEHMEAGKASISVLGVPVVSVISGVIFLNEPLTLFMILGMLMILSGIILVQHS